MAWSKHTRISVMLVLDTIFFFLELIVGMLVKSLALLADAFHMVSYPTGTSNRRYLNQTNSLD